MMKLASTGVWPSEADLLLELYLEEPLSQSNLAERLDNGHSTIGKTVTRLENGGFVARSKLTEDRRSIMVSLTPKGRTVYEAFLARGIAHIEEINRVIGAANALQMTEWLTRLAEHFRAEADYQPLEEQRSVLPAARSRSRAARKVKP